MRTVDELRERLDQHELSEVHSVSGRAVEVRLKKPGTGIDSMRFILRRGRLIVTGDLGDAVYWWGSQDLTFAFLAGCDLDYFASKCTASEFGKGNLAWDPERAAKRLADEGVTKEQIEELLLDSPFATQEEWRAFLWNHGDELLGENALELARVGFVPSIRCRMHLAGLRRVNELMVENVDLHSRIEDRPSETP